MTEHVSPVRCPACNHTVFEVQINATSTDFDVEVGGCDRFPIDQTVLEQPDSIAMEAVCRNCGHFRYIPFDEWEWA